MTISRQTVLAHGAAALAALSAGTAVVATRVMVSDIEPVSLAFFRYVIGSACFLPLLPFIWPKHRLLIADYAKIAILGLLFFSLFSWGLNAALEIIPASRGAVGLATVPIQTLLVAALFGREAMTMRKIIGVALAFTGVAIVFGPSAFSGSLSETLSGDIYMMLGVFCAALYSVFSRQSLLSHGPLFVTALAMVFGTIALLVMTLLIEGTPSIPALDTDGWLVLIFLGTIASAVQFALFTWALRWLPPSTTVLYIALNPITAMLLGALMIGESVTLPLVLALAMVLTAILISSGLVRLPRKQEAAEPK